MTDSNAKYTEIETKLKVEDLSPIQTLLHTLGAELSGHLEQTDVYLDNSNQDMKRGDKCLRIRLETVNGKTRTLITFKGPKQQAEVKCRQEVELPVPDAGQIQILFQGLGYEPSLTVQKQRKLWQYKQCDVCLDRVNGLGEFVEIEGPSSERIMEVKEDLGLNHITHCQESYACLIAETKS